MPKQVGRLLLIMPDWKDRSNSQFGRRRAAARRQSVLRPGKAWQRALAVARERQPRHFAEWQAPDPVCHRHPIDFRALPRSCDPLWGGGVPPIRAWRKRRQIENVMGPLAELTALLKRPAHIVDFCASSGHVALPAVAVLAEQGVTVEINDLRERPIDIARKRIAALPPALRARCTARVFSTETRMGPFDIGVALHACGVATDVVLETCLRQRAAFVLIPCCVGRLAQKNRGRNAQASLPKTEAFLKCADLPKSSKWCDALSSDEAKALARAGDCTARDKLTADDRERRACKTVIDGDRLALAAERGYTASHFVMRPFGITPKNDVIVGYPSEWRGELVCPPCARDC